MLRLNLKKEAYWMDLPSGVRLKVRPLSSAIMSAAQAAVIKQISDWRHEIKSRSEIGADVSDIPDVDDEHTRIGLTEALLVSSLARGAIIAWEGVMDRTGNAVAPVNDQTIKELMTIWFVAQDFWKQYSAEISLLEVEGNSSRLAVNGTSAAGQDIAEDAKKKISPAAEANPAT